MKTLVLGIGNTLLGDDGAGILVVRQVAGLVNSPDICFKETGAAGLNLLDLIIGFEKLIVVDAILVDKGHTGEVIQTAPESLEQSEKAVSIHSCGLNAALALARKMCRDEAPRQVSIIGIGIRQVDMITESLSPEVEAALPKAVKSVIVEISGRPDNSSAVPVSFIN